MLRRYLGVRKLRAARQALDPRGDGQVRSACERRLGVSLMRIGLVVEQFDPLRGGLEQWTYRLVEKLAERGHEIHVVSREFAAQARRLAA